MDAAPILVLIFIWGIAGFIGKLSKAGKTAQTSRNRRPAVQRPGTNAPKQADSVTAPQPQPEESPVFRPTVMHPSVSVTEHDDSVYQGSMSAITGEGYDPCHDEQMAPLNAAEAASPETGATVPGLQLSWTGSDVVRGIVMSEILKRK